MFSSGFNCMEKPRDDNQRINKFLSGDKEKEHGLTYVGISRVITHERLDIGPGH
jgi:hypothetical protein